MSVFTPSPKFYNAASYLSSAPSLPKVSSKVKLELYGLFKFLTVSPIPNTTRPSVFDIPGRAKWDAWKSTASSYEGRPGDAEMRYLDIAQSLGWVENADSIVKTSPESDKTTDEGIWDEDSGEGGSGSRGDILGMGNAVSMIAVSATDENNSVTIHGLALSNDAGGLATFVRENPNIDVNEPDEFGYTPLHLASDRGNTAVVELLLQKGADPSLKDPDDLTASELAHVAGHEDIRIILEKAINA